MSVVDECDAASTRSMQRAFLLQLDECGSMTCVAGGEYRPNEGVFSVESVLDGYHDLDVAGIPLGSMEGGVITLEDLEDVGLELDWDDEVVVAGPSDEDLLSGSEQAGEALQAEDTLTSTTTAPGVQSAPPARAELIDAACQSDPQLSKISFDMHDIRVRAMTDSGGTGKLVPLGDFLKLCKQEGKKKPPILTPTERVREAQQAAGSWRAHYGKKSEETGSLRAQLEQLQHEMVQLKRLHAIELSELDLKHSQELQAVREHERQQERARADKRSQVVRPRNRRPRTRRPHTRHLAPLTPLHPPKTPPPSPSPP